jgi:cytochrome c biogenesis protein CcmG/thiol:disulfide interchange protein DsbE
MIKRFGPPVAALLLGLAAAVYFQLGGSRRAGFPAPDFALPDLNGRLQRLSDFRGKVVFLNVWATWCPPCRMEMPAMETLYRRLKGRDFVMLAVSQDDEGLKTVKPFVEKNGLTFPVLLDPKASVSGQYGVTGYPETFVIDREGKVVQHVIGPENWENDQSYRYFLGLLQTQPKASQASAGQSAGGG